MMRGEDVWHTLLTQLMHSLRRELICFHVKLVTDALGRDVMFTDR